MVKEHVKHPVRTGKHLVATRKEVRYLISGSLSEALELVSFVILIWLSKGEWLYVINSFTFFLGVSSGFILHQNWSFPGEKRFKTHHQIAGYFGLAAINFVIINVLVGYFVRGLDMWPPLAKLIAICITVIWSYLLVTLVIFRITEEKDAPDR